MNAQQIEQKILQHTRDLPEKAQLEILDFVLFLWNKNKSMKADLSSLNKTELDHLEEEFKNYKELFPYEE